MADDVPITAGAWTAVSADDAGGIRFQRVELVDGAADSTAVIPGGAAGGPDVDAARRPALGVSSILVEDR